jgi:hypothetical protein
VVALPFAVICGVAIVLPSVSFGRVRWLCTVCCAVAWVRSNQKSLAFTSDCSVLIVRVESNRLSAPAGSEELQYFVIFAQVCVYPASNWCIALAAFVLPACCLLHLTARLTCMVWT